MGLAFRSVLVLGVMFGLVFAVLAAAVYYFQAPLWIAVVAAVAAAAFQYLIGPYIIEFVLKINWKEPHELPDVVRRAIEKHARASGIPVPRVGEIEDGNPNAFTFGHYPGNARVVYTTGLLEICDDDEVEAVLAHEVGHIAHWDFVVMTVAVAAVMALYYTYVVMRQAGTSRRRGGGALVVALGAFVAYVIAEYLALFLSRLREYYAPRHPSIGRTSRQCCPAPRRHG